MIFGFLVNMENTIHILIPPLGPLSIKNNALPMNSCFDDDLIVKSITKGNSF